MKIMEQCANGPEVAIMCTSPCIVNQMARRKRTSKELWFNAQIEEYNMDNIILDLGPKVNILPKITCQEMIGKPKLTWSSIQLQFTKQHYTFPIRQVTGMKVDIGRVSIIVNFEVIKILDNINPYHALLWINWAFDN